MIAEDARTIAVIGATGAQGGGVVQALQRQGHFKVRALTRNPDKARGLGDEVVAADLTQPDSLATAFAGVYGVFVNTDAAAGPDVDELAQGTAAVQAARIAGVEHFIWSTLPDVEEISHGTLNVPHYTNKAKVDKVVAAAGFSWTTFVEAPFYFQNLTGAMAPQPGPDGTLTFSLPMTRGSRCIHIGDVTELGNIVAGAFENPAEAGQGQHLSYAGDLLSWDDIVATLNDQGHNLAYSQVPTEVWDTLFPAAPAISQMLEFYEAHTHFGPDADAKIALAADVSIKPFTDFATWAQKNMPATA